MDKAIVIPEIKKNVAFTNDLVKKLAGTTLIQRVIDKAREIPLSENIFVLTDADTFFDNMVSFPFHHWMSGADIEYKLTSVREVLGE